jgi:hypothetical protein
VFQSEHAQEDWEGEGIIDHWVMKGKKEEYLINCKGYMDAD